MSERRLHPAAVLDQWISLLKRVGLYALLPIVVRTSRDGLVPVLVQGGLVAAAFVVPAVIHWLRFRYEVYPDRLVVRGGLLQRYERTIPVTRIQSIDTVERLRHRLFGVVELRVEAIGGGQTEGKLSPIPRAEAERIREVLLPSSEQAGVREAPPLVRLSGGQVLLAGVTGGRVAVLALVMGTVSDFLPEDFEPDKIAGSGAPPVVSILFFAAAALTVILLVSLIATMFVYWKFTVRREGDKLVIERGLLERRRAIAPLHRVQVWRIQQNLLRRPFGLATVSARIAGYGGEAQEVQVSSVLLPVASLSAARDLVSGLLPKPIDVGTMPLEPAPVRALRRRITRGVAAGLIIGGVLTLWLGPAGAVGFVSVGFGLALAVLAWRALGHAVTEHYVVTRSGVFVRTTTVVSLSNIQVLRLEASPLQRLAKLASVRFKVPRTSTTAIDLDRLRAEERFAHVRTAILTAPAGDAPRGAAGP